MDGPEGVLIVGKETAPGPPQASDRVGHRTSGRT